ncbi:hypothetical protein ACEV6Q_04115 [Enterobacter ludwigii]|uniref:hypothetical protein n=1 Tax=Enterobacter ludwigii TaxID=299767 RepID=UPI003BEEB1D0
MKAASRDIDDLIYLRKVKVGEYFTHLDGNSLYMRVGDRVGRFSCRWLWDTTIQYVDASSGQLYETDCNMAVVLTKAKVVAGDE